MTSSVDAPSESASLRISYLFSQFPVATQAFAISDIAELRAQGHSVMVHNVKPPPADFREQLSKWSVPEGVPISHLSRRRALRWPALLWRMRAPTANLLSRILRGAISTPTVAISALLSLPRILEIVSEIEDFGSDVVHIFWSRHAGMSLPVLAQNSNSCLRSSFSGAYDLVADDFLVDMTLDWSEVVFSHAEVNRPVLEPRLPAETPLEIVRRGIPLLERDLTVERDPDLWITASALVASKNVEAVIRAFDLARNIRPTLRLEVFGDGPDRQRLEECCRRSGLSDAVKFCGHIPRAALFRRMERSATFLLLSQKQSERLPNVIKEALWAGCAVISSRTEGIEELIPDHEIGHVIDPDDKDAMLNALNEVLTEADRHAAERRERAAQFIAENFSSEVSMNLYVAAWRKGLLKKRDPQMRISNRSLSGADCEPGRSAYHA